MQYHCEAFNSIAVTFDLPQRLENTDSFPVYKDKLNIEQPFIIWKLGCTDI